MVSRSDEPWPESRERVRAPRRRFGRASRQCSFAVGDTFLTGTPSNETTPRNEDLAALATMLRDQQARKVDFVALAANIRADEGMITVTGAEAKITEDGVTQVDGIYRPTSVMLDGLAAKLNVPVGYLKRMHQTRPDLFDVNVNGLLHGRKAVRAAVSTN